MRVLFAGGKNVGCGCLDKLVEHPEVELVAVYAGPDDTAADRWYRSATDIAVEHGTPVYFPKKINSRETVALTRSLTPDLIVVVYYDQILHSETIRIPGKGCVNLHLALGEDYRGCYPTTHALLDRAQRYGVTLHYIDEGIDTGDIIAQRPVPISDADTGKTLYDNATKAGIELFGDVLPHGVHSL